MYQISRLKYLITFVFALVAQVAVSQEASEVWTHRIEVKSGQEDFEGESVYAYSITVYEVKDSVQKDSLVQFSTSWAIADDNRDQVDSAMQMDLPRLKTKESTAVVHSVGAGEAARDVRVILAFVNGKHVLNPKDFPKGDAAVRKMMHELGLTLNRIVVSDQVADAQADLSELEIKHKTCIAQKTGFEKYLSDNELKLSLIEKNNADLSIRLAKEKSKAESLKSITKSKSATTQDLKNYDAAVEYVTKVEEQILSGEQDKVKMRDEISETKSAIPQKQEEIIALSVQLADQKTRVAKLQVKRNKIQ